MKTLGLVLMVILILWPWFHCKLSIDFIFIDSLCLPNFAGGFNQPFMCGGEPRAMLMKSRGQNDSPFYTIQICVPKHG